MGVQSGPSAIAFVFVLLQAGIAFAQPELDAVRRLVNTDLVRPDFCWTIDQENMLAHDLAKICDADVLKALASDMKGQIKNLEKTTWSDLDSDRGVIRRVHASWQDAVEFGDNVDSPPDLVRGIARILPALAALRDWEGKSPPIRVDVGDATCLECTPVSLPLLKVRITNSDEDGQSIAIDFPGSRTCDRFQSLAVCQDDLADNLLRAKVCNSILAGGQSATRVLSAGEFEEYDMDFAKYIMAPQVGNYTIRIGYFAFADSEAVVSKESLQGRRSAFFLSPFVLKVGRIEQDLSLADRDNLVKLISGLPSASPVVVLDHPYGAWAHGIIAPESVQGRILAIGVSAIPELVKVGRSETDSLQRSWALALLFAISGQLDPRPRSPGLHGAIGPYLEEVDFGVVPSAIRNGGSIVTGHMQLPQVAIPGIDEQFRQAVLAQFAQERQLRLKNVLDANEQARKFSEWEALVEDWFESAGD